MVTNNRARNTSGETRQPPPTGNQMKLDLEIESALDTYSKTPEFVSKERLVELLRRTRGRMGEKGRYPDGYYHECINRSCVYNRGHDGMTMQTTRRNGCALYKTEKTMMQCIDKVTKRRSK